MEFSNKSSHLSVHPLLEFPWNAMVGPGLSEIPGLYIGNRLLLPGQAWCGVPDHTDFKGERLTKREIKLCVCIVLI